MDEKYLTVKISLCALQSDWDEPEHKLAHLILEGEIFCNDGWWFKKENKPWQEGYITHHVNCNDVFAWGCADAEDITYDKIGELYEMWKKDPVYGTAAWCIRKRKMMPQKPVEEAMRKAGVWNLEELIKETP